MVLREWFHAALVVASASHTDAKSLWSNVAANANDLIRTTLPLGNGRLGGMPFGGVGAEQVTLNLDSLWSGGPFEATNYTGGNPNEAAAPALAGIRDWIFENGTGNVTELLGYDGEYGSYRVLGNLSVTIPSLQLANVSATNYSRSLNLQNGIHATRFTFNGDDFETMIFCSFPDQVCVYSLESTNQLPTLILSLDNTLVNSTLQDVTCDDSGYTRLRGVTQLGPPRGMQYDAIAHVVQPNNADMFCSAVNELVVVPRNGTNSMTVVVGADTDYDRTKGTREHGYSFRGEDPGPTVEKTVKTAAAKNIAVLKNDHVQDFERLTSRFELTLPDTKGSENLPTAEIIARYNADDDEGDPFLEGLLFDYASYMFISSSRPGSLPPNLQGRWSEGLTGAWSSDYHANINLQMNHWTPDQTGLTDLQTPLWDYMADSWVPRGQETAKLLYDAPGWVAHNEMNIFGHTGMKSGESWANYPAAPAWMMQHVFDHWDYSHDQKWLMNQAYPMIRGVAQFWHNQLQMDELSGDDSLVVNPCSSPEHGPTTFGCAHYQQLIHQVFEAVLALHPQAGETDEDFIQNITQSLVRLDKGFHVGGWGQIKEWKLPDLYGYDFINDTHRHLSELVGWYPGYSISSFLGGYTNTTIQDTINQKLYSRGPGDALGATERANAGWAKVWRSACWARLNNTERAHFELRYAIEQNFGPNGFSMYNGERTPFQIDANFGFGGAVLSMLVVDLPSAVGDDGVRTVVLGPAIPTAWAKGSVRGLRLRGGGEVSFGWDEQGIVVDATIKDRTMPLRVVNKNGTVLVEA